MLGREAAAVERVMCQMARRDTYNCTNRLGRKISHRDNTNNPARREREYEWARPASKPTANTRSNTRAGAQRVEGGQIRTRGYYA